MRIWTMAVMTAGISLAALGAQAGQITVTGEGRVDGAPDMATVSLGVTTEGETAAAALSANSAELAKVMDRLTGAGIAARDIQTSGLSLNPNWQQDSTGSTPPRIAGYVASNMVTLRVRALDGLGGVLDAAVQDGANTLNGVEFGLSEPGPALDEARRRAVTDAKARAALLAEAAGVALGPIASIQEGGGLVAPVPMMRMAADMAGAPPIAAGEVTMTTSVTIVWEIKE